MPLKIYARIVPSEEDLAWNKFINECRWGDILQFSQWGSIKANEGWSSLKVGVFAADTGSKVEGSEQLILAGQILYKKATFLGNYAYMPHGPVFDNHESLENGLPVLSEFVSKLAKEYNFFCLEVEPKIGFLSANNQNQIESQGGKNLEHFFTGDLLKVFKNNGFIQTGRNMQPKHKLYYDLGLGEDELIQQCQKNTRYNIRLAKKKGVQVIEYTPDSPEIKSKVAEFYDLMLITQKRAKGYPIRPFKSFLTMFEAFKGTNNLSLFEAMYDGQTIAMNISQRTKWWSSSFYAASNRLHSKVKSMYLLRWESILAAKSSGSKSYDFWGIIPNSSQHSGYSDHKLSFGGYRVETYGLLALPFNKLYFMIWNQGIWFRTRIVDRFRKLIWKVAD
ncbi:MAG: peptidoglycan bridge formation glycyltransferase FemA/FemB family protein [Patescibacteria group bacterium]